MNRVTRMLRFDRAESPGTAVIAELPKLRSVRRGRHMMSDRMSMVTLWHFRVVQSILDSVWIVGKFQTRVVIDVKGANQRQKSSISRQRMIMTRRDSGKCDNM
jgi:hypothetical protein